MKDRTVGKTISGVIFILIGTLILFLRDSNLSLFHLLLGGVFLAGYFYSQSYGLLIPGCILTSLALSAVRTSYFGFKDLDVFGLGIGFVAIYVIDRLYRGKSHWWPLIPGIILIIAGLDSLHRVFSLGWPVILILLGVWLIIKSIAKKA